ncbi:hypothetical protein HHI36_017077 [Cryptolaemus montrouzieri]|uniref:Uncharacterized protein n=1 Tax=Cryptolaemus montrouzieri TaxID=559131 RepID=A0ABD2NLY6_9CUCU
MVSSVYLTVSYEEDVLKLVVQMDFRLTIEITKPLTSFESNILTAAAAAQYVSFLSRPIYRIAHILAYQTSWMGAKNTIRVKNMRFIKLITDVIDKQWDTANYSELKP